MKKKILAAALVASLPLFAQAQTAVTMYGVVDASVGIEDTDTPGTDSTFVVQSGTQSTSRIGFRGTEELGNGLKAMFNIEADVFLDTGAGNNTLFQRRAVVGLEGGFGAVTVGREYSPAAAIALASDALGHGFYGSSLSSFVGTERLTRRLSNSVNYKSKAWNGVTVGAAYSAGEQQTGESRDLKGVSLEATNFGIYLGAAYQETDLPTGKKKEFASGAGYKWSTSKCALATWSLTRQAATTPTSSSTSAAPTPPVRTSSSCRPSARNWAMAPRATASPWPTRTPCRSAPTCTAPSPS